MRRIAVLLALLVVLLTGILPLGSAMLEAFTGETSMAEVLGHDYYYITAVAWSAQLSVAAAVGAMLIGVPFALLTARTDLPGRRFFAATYGAPLILPPLLMAMAWDSLAPPSSIVGSASYGRELTFLQATALFSLAYFPFVTLFARRALAGIGAGAEEAGLVHAGPWWTLRRVTLPLARPGIILGGLFAFLFTLNDFSVVDYLNIFRTPSQQIPIFAWVMQMEFSRKLANIPALLLMALPMAVVSLIVGAGALREAARLPTATVGSGWRPPRPYRLGPVGKVLGVLFCGGILAAGVLVPGGQLVAESGGIDTIRRVLQSGGAADALGLSLGLAFGAVLITVPVAIVLAEAARRAGTMGQVSLGLLVLAPLLVTPSVLPIGALGMWNMDWLTTTRNGAPWNPVYDTPLLAALVVIARVLPFTVAATWASLREIEPSLHEAGTLTGVPWDVRMRRLVIPLARPGIGLGAVLAFVFTLRELDGIAVVQTDVLVRRMWSALHFARDESVAAMAVILLIVMGIAVGAAWLGGLLRPRNYSASARASRTDS